jgi:hypothetical protein
MSERTEPIQTAGSAGPKHLHRREFLLLLSASVAAPYLMGLPRPLWAAGTGAPAAGLVPLSLGFLRGSDAMVADAAVLRGLNDPRRAVLTALRGAVPEGSPLEVVPLSRPNQQAGDFPSGEAMLWIHGMYPPARARDDRAITSVTAEVDFFLPGGSQPFSYLAWSYAERPVVNEAAPVGFKVPVGGGSAIRVRINVARFERGTRAILGPAVDAATSGAAALAPARGERLASQFADPGRPNELSLGPGIYFLPLGTAASQALPFDVTADYLVPDTLPFLVVSMVPNPGASA